jgi:hypothetical protein
MTVTSRRFDMSIMGKGLRCAGVAIAALAVFGAAAPGTAVATWRGGWHGGGGFDRGGSLGTPHGGFRGGWHGGFGYRAGFRPGFGGWRGGYGYGWRGYGFRTGWGIGYAAGYYPGYAGYYGGYAPAVYAPAPVYAAPVYRGPGIVHHAAYHHVVHHGCRCTCCR